MKIAYCGLALMLMASPSFGASRKDARSASLEAYLSRVRSAPVAAVEQRTPGSLWVESGVLSDAISDHCAKNVGDTVTIYIQELTSAETSASVDTQRKFEANSGVDALPGKINTSGVASLFSPHSSQTLQGQGQSTANSKLQTILSGVVVAVLPSGSLVIEARRDVMINNQRNQVLLRGIVRPADVSAENSVPSSKLSELEVELSGRGVVSDGTRQPNLLMRWLLRILNF